MFAKSADLLTEGVREKMAEANLDLNWLESMPYTVSACGDFEDVCQIISDVGINSFFSLKKSGGSQIFQIRDLEKSQLNSVSRKTVRRALFKDEWRRILPPQVLPSLLELASFSGDN
ncbi:hypothetical protein D3C78_1609630 [compost metagenome]